MSPNRARAAPTLLDVARAVGVSRTSVSNAYNRPEKLSTDLREAIFATARTLGYLGPDPRAASLRRKRVPGTVGVVLHHDLSYMFQDVAGLGFLTGLSLELDERSLSLHLIPKVERRLLLSAAHQSTADAIVVHSEVGDEFAAELKALRKPLVLVDALVPGVRSVGIDDRAGAVLAMNHVLTAEPEVVVVVCFRLSDPERRRIHARGRMPRSGFVGTERLAGYLQALRAANFSAQQVAWIEVDDQYPETAREAVAAVRDTIPPGQRLALVAMSDRIALAVQGEVRRWRDRRVVAVVGFDDIPQAAAAGLTTIRQDHERKGREAVRALLDEPFQAHLPLELVVRKT